MSETLTALERTKLSLGLSNAYERSTIRDISGNFDNITDDELSAIASAIESFFVQKGRAASSESVDWRILHGRICGRLTIGNHHV